MRFTQSQKRLIESSDLFDADWYVKHYPDVRKMGIDPVEHYLRLGALLLRNPSTAFNTRFYLQRNPDVVASGMNPLYHYLAHGLREKREIVPHLLSRSSVTTDVDVVVPVFDALAETKACLESLRVHEDGLDVRIIVVNDGSSQETTEWLEEYCSLQPRITLINHPENLGYTRAVNTGLHASTARFVVTLNSDTIVTTGWLRAMIRCMASSPEVGIVGPLSNAASWQNVPTLLDDSGHFAVNDLPDGCGPEEMARIVAATSRRLYPKVPFVNGFCFMIKRQVIHLVGHMDEETFPVGYGEENDYCIRAADAGFALAIADDAFVFHAKSRSFGHEKRKELSGRGSEALKRKHTSGRVNELVERIKQVPGLDEARARVQRALASRKSSPAPLDVTSLRILFVLPVAGGGGGAHSVVQEAAEMRRLGTHAHVAVRDRDVGNFVAQYADLPAAEDLFVGFDGKDLSVFADNYDVVVATIFWSMESVWNLCQECPHVMPAYYVQDYEPLFFAAGSDNWEMARNSYELAPNAVLFAKTHWIIDKVAAEHGRPVHKVEPSIDHGLFRPLPSADDGRIQIAAMIRPQTARRGADRTMRILRRLKAQLGDSLAIHIFGCPDTHPLCQHLERDFEHRDHGVLLRTEVATLLARCDMFLDLSDYQAFGRTALEAMAAYCVAVVPAHGGADEYAVDGVNAVLVDSFDEDECLNKVSALLQSPESLQRLRLSALRTASRYSVHRAAMSELALFATELAEHRLLNPKPLKSKLTLLHAVRKDGATPSGSAWVRCLLPYRSRAVCSGWQVTIGSRQMLPAPGSADVVIFQRDAAGVPLDILDAWLKEWHGHGGKLIYDVDDDLLDIEGILQRGYIGDTGQLLRSIRMLVQSADLVTVSTKTLAVKFQEHNANVRIVPNRIDAKLWQMAQPASDSAAAGGEKRPLRIGYMGTPTHDADLAMLSPVMRQLEQEFGEQIAIEVIGGFEHTRPSFGTRIGLPRKNDYPHFVRWLREVANWDIALLPLANDRFNASKSNLKFLEYAAMGAAIACSDHEAYRDIARDGSNALVVPHEEAWCGTIRRLVEDASLRERLAETARRTVRENHTIEGACHDYVDVLASVCHQNPAGYRRQAKSAGALK